MAWLSAFVYLLINTYLSTVQCNFVLLASKLPSKMDVFATAFYNNQYIVTINGHAEPQYPLQTYSTSTNLSTWNLFDNIKTQFIKNISTSEVLYYGQSFIQVHNTVYGVPIYDGNKQHKLFKYNLIENRYYAHNTYNYLLPQPTNRSCVCYINDRLFIIGGRLNNLFQIYSISSDTWNTNTSSLNIARYNSGCATVDNQYIYILGGYKDTHLNSIEKYTLTSEKWILLNETFDTARSLHRCVFVNDFNSYIYCIGGENNSGVLNTMEVFNTRTDLIISQYFINTTLNIAREDFGLLNINNQYLLVLGGHNKGNYDTIEKLNLTQFLMYTNFSTTEVNQSILETIVETVVESTVISIVEGKEWNYLLFIIIGGSVCVIVMVNLCVIGIIIRKTKRNKLNKPQLSLGSGDVSSSHRVQMNRELNLQSRSVRELAIKARDELYAETAEKVSVMKDSHKINVEKSKPIMEGKQKTLQFDGLSDSEMLYDEVSKQSTFAIEGKATNTTADTLKGSHNINVNV
eukprot:409161_1